MNNVLEIVKHLCALRYTGSVDMETVIRAEETLQLSFAKEYIGYTCSFGAISFIGHEITGICNSSRLNVITITTLERNLNPSVPSNYYVIEQAHIDGIVIWQDQNGTIYQSKPNCQPVRICNSLAEYLESNS